jgi:deoxycytidine triphosphate deaminase
VLLSDRDLRAEIDAGRLVVDPYDEAMVQPSSIDVRLDRFFRVFENHRYPHIDPAEEQDELTRLVESPDDEPFILHPGEFVLGSTYEVIGLADDLAARLEGKALQVDTPIPTVDGFKLMDQIEVGDEVFDESGRRTKVVGVGPVMTRPAARVLFSDDSEIIADLEHLWWTSTKLERYHRDRTSGSVRTTAEIGSELRRAREWNHHVPLVEGAVDYPTRALPVDPYVLGVWLGDGTTTQANVTCHPKDRQILDEIERAGYPVTATGRPMYWRVGGAPRVRDAKTGQYAATASLHSTLKRIRVLGDKHVPEIYFIADAAQRLALLQGLMDSDGYCDVYGRCEFVSVKEELSLAVHELAASLGLRPKLRKKRAMLNGIDCGPAYQVKFVPHVPVFRLERKLARQKLTDKLHRHRSVVAVEPVGLQFVRCIEVAAPSGLYLAGTTYIPTHNSSLGRLGLLTHSTAGFIDPGFNGHVTLELSNVATLPIKLWPGMKIGQVCVLRLTSAAEHPYGSAVYGSRYQGQRGPTPSRSWKNFSRTPLGDGQ